MAAQEVWLHFQALEELSTIDKHQRSLVVQQQTDEPKWMKTYVGKIDGEAVLASAPTGLVLQESPCWDSASAAPLSGTC
jgi:hypothetical protein